MSYAIVAPQMLVAAAADVGGYWSRQDTQQFVWLGLGAGAPLSHPLPVI
jgi:hypothetical protein